MKQNSLNIKCKSRAIANYFKIDKSVLFFYCSFLALQGIHSHQLLSHSHP